MAGLFIARRLALAGRRVAVLESGNDAFDEHTHQLNTIVDVYGRYTRALDGRYRGLGGSSSRWGGRIIPIYAEDVSARAHLSQPGWPISYQHLRRYQPEVEDVFGLPHGPFDKEAMGQIGIDSVFLPDDPDITGRLAKWINFRQCNLGTIWRAELDRLDNLELWLGATVNTFELDRQKGLLGAVEAINFNGRSIRVSARHFVMAAGTIESTRLLLWLNRQSGGHAFAGTAALGRYMQDHLKAEVATIARQDQARSTRLFGYHYIDGARRSLHLDLTTAAQRELGTPSAFAYAAMDLSGSPMSRIKAVARGIQGGKVALDDIVALLGQLPLVARSAYWRLVRKQVYMPASVRLGMQIAIEQQPHWSNHIALSDERDGMGMPKAAVHWRPQGEDETAFRAVAKTLRKYWTRMGLDRDHPLQWLVAETDGAMAFTDIAQAYAHPSGTARMGTDKNSSVVDSNLVCHGVPNLSVASAAAFPTAGSANPTLTILELALRHADFLLGNRGGHATARPAKLAQPS